MFDISWGEMALVGAVALVVIGPAELPKALRTLGQATAKLRRMAGEFRSQFDEAMREAEVADIRRDLHDVSQAARESTMKGFDPIGTIRNEIKGTPPAAAAEASVAVADVPIEASAPLPADPIMPPLPPEAAPLDLSPLIEAPDAARPVSPPEPRP